MESEQDLETYDTNAQKATAIIVADRAEQDPWESRRAWGHVIDALNRGNMQATSDEKGKVERAQRLMRKDEENAGTKWRQTFFRTVESDPLFKKLAAKAGNSLEVERTQGIWKFDRDALKKEKPYQGDLTPTGKADARMDKSMEYHHTNGSEIGESSRDERSKAPPQQESVQYGRSNVDVKEKTAIEEMLRNKYSYKNK